MNPSTDLVNKLWRLCAVLRKDGITYQQYVTELTYLLYLKMAAERGIEADLLPPAYRWGALLKLEGKARLDFYRKLLVEAGLQSGNRATLAIFDNAATFIREPRNLDTLVLAIEELQWFASAQRDAFGDLYEGLLQKNAEETKKGAGQYFTPRALIQTLVRLMQPRPGEIIQDPATGTGGFLIAADRHIRGLTDDYLALEKVKDQEFQVYHAIHGMENVPGVYRLLLMNLQLHGIDSKHILLGDTLSDAGSSLAPADVILTNPPFGPAGGKPTRDDLSVTATVSSYQLPFVEHCIRNLKSGGRAAIVVPDNVLFEDGRGRDLRQMLMERCDLHTILRLPTGIFYAQGVKTNVIFFRKGLAQSNNTEAVWIYDLRARMPAFGKTAPLTEAHFAAFEAAFGTDPHGDAPRTDEGEEGRFRRFSRAEIAARNDNLDISWLREESDAEEGLSEPSDLVAAITGHLRAALLEIEALADELDADAAALADLPEAAE